jgi:hypothetical protein
MEFINSVANNTLYGIPTITYVMIGLTTVSLAAVTILDTPEKSSSSFFTPDAPAAATTAPAAAAASPIAAITTPIASMIPASIRGGGGKKHGKKRKTRKHK